MGHIHAAAMAEYAKDAAETDMPWERWEISITESGDEYRKLLGHPEWAVTRKYRRKPKTILINGHEVPEPCRTPLQVDTYYWVPDLFCGTSGYHWQDDVEDNRYLRNGFIHLTREAAEKHYEAIKSFTAQEVKHESCQ